MRAVETVGMLALMLTAAGCVTWMVVQLAAGPALCGRCGGLGCRDCALEACSAAGGVDAAHAAHGCARDPYEMGADV